MVESFSMSPEQKKLHKIICSLFDLTNKQGKLFIKIYSDSDKFCCLNHLTDEMKPGRSTLQKYIKVLLDKGLVQREAKTLAEFQEVCQKHDHKAEYNTTKGYLYMYRPIPKEKLLKKARNIWNSWNQELESQI